MFWVQGRIQKSSLSAAKKVDLRGLSWSSKMDSLLSGFFLRSHNFTIPWRNRGSESQGKTHFEKSL
jgi:hypothetical protein